MNHNFKAAAVVLAAAATLGLATPAVAAKGSYIVMGSGDTLPANIDRDIRKAGGAISRLVPEIGMAVVSSDRSDFAAKARKISGVSEVAPNLTVQWIEPTENVALGEDFGNPPASGDDDPFFDLQWGATAVQAPDAWNLGYRGAGARVAVLDSGFDLDHPDLVPNINFALSKDFTGEGLQYLLPDTFSHGTHTAGTIAAADNGFGVIGIAPEAELVLVKVLGDGGSGSFGDLIAGIVYAADNDADVISMSLGATLPRSAGCDDPADPDTCYTGADLSALVNAVNKATTYAYQKGSTVIAAAGNEGMDFNHTADYIHTPSSGPNVISISATAPIGWGVDSSTDLDHLASYSNYGTSGIDFGAPGGDYLYYFVNPTQLCTVAGLSRPCYVFDYVFSTGNNGWYWSSGTSMATPHAAGVAAIIIGKNGGSMKPAQVEAALRASADDLGKPGKDDAYGSGRVNAYNAVK
jgi:subtilisin family serine protease